MSHKITLIYPKSTFSLKQSHLKLQIILEKTPQVIHAFIYLEM